MGLARRLIARVRNGQAERMYGFVEATARKSERSRGLGLTGLEPVTLRLSSACSNQLSYRPGIVAAPRNFRISIADFRFYFAARFARIYLNRQSKFANRKSRCPPSSRSRGTAARQPPKAFG